MKESLRLYHLRKAQRGICAGCGRSVPKRAPKGDPLAGTFDHIVPKSAGGTRIVWNGLLKHAACNYRRGNAAPTGCDMIWHAVVLAYMGRRRAGSDKLLRVVLGHDGRLYRLRGVPRVPA